MRPTYARRRPERTPLYVAVQETYESFVATCEEADRPLPGFVQQEFDSYLRCGILAHGFARVRCSGCGHDMLVGLSCTRRGFCPSCLGRRMNESAAYLAHRVIGDVGVRHWVLSLPYPLRALLAYDPALTGEVLGAFLKAVFRWLRLEAKHALGLGSVSEAHPGAVTVIQRASSNLQLNPHFHSLVTDGVFVRDQEGAPVFHRLRAPSAEEVSEVAWETCKRTLKILKRRGLWDEDDGSLDADGLSDLDPALARLYGESVRGVLSFGAGPGQRLACFHGEVAGAEVSGAGRRSGHGFNLHAGSCVSPGDRPGVERLARYLLRPPIAQSRLKRKADGTIRLTFKRPWRDGTAGVDFEPLDFLAKLAALVPRPRNHQVRYHGAYSPNASLRTEVLPEPDPAIEELLWPGCGKGGPGEQASPTRIRWAQLLKHIWDDDLTCPSCGVQMELISIILERDVVKKILEAVGLPADSPTRTPPSSHHDLAA